VKSKEDKIQFYYWGPLLTKHKVEPEKIQELLRRGKNCNTDYRTELAGIIDKEFSYPMEDVQWFANSFQNHFMDYLHVLKEWKTNMKHPLKTLSIEKLWINFMQKNEFNPPHVHSGAFSFVIYLEVPKDIKNEKLIGTAGDPGSICFLYGQPMADDPTTVTGQTFVPEVGDMFIFPANLQHYVIPFKSDGIRTSVYGNLSYELEK